MGTVSIKSLVAADFQAWEPLWRGYLDFYRASLSSEITRTSFARLTSGAEPMGGFLASADGGPAIGMVNWIFHRSTWSLGDYCYLQDLFVAPEARGSGAATALVQAVYTKAREAKCSRVYWLTHETNDRAIRLYDRLAERSGFVQYRKML